MWKGNPMTSSVSASRFNYNDTNIDRFNLCNLCLHMLMLLHLVKNLSNRPINQCFFGEICWSFFPEITFFP